MEKQVTRVPVKPKMERLKNVAVYARVSSGKDAMLHSLAAQVSYYSQMIREQPGWRFAGVYADEAMTGTKDTRDEFQRLLADCRAGHIDMVITKSVSRFARNTVTSLETVRELKLLGVDVYFEKENIFTLDGKGELLLTIMSSITQEKSRNISENVTWGMRKRFADGKVTMPYGQFMGYRRGKDGTLEVVEAEADVVRTIFRRFLEGATPAMISRELNLSGIPCPSRKVC